MHLNHTSDLFLDCCPHKLRCWHFKHALLRTHMKTLMNSLQKRLKAISDIAEANCYNNKIIAT